MYYISLLLRASKRKKCFTGKICFIRLPVQWNVEKRGEAKEKGGGSKGNIQALEPTGR